jgi:hypothetical protein
MRYLKALFQNLLRGKACLPKLLEPHSGEIVSGNSRQLGLGMSVCMRFRAMSDTFIISISDRFRAL